MLRKSLTAAADRTIYIITEVVRDKPREGEGVLPLRYRVIHYRYADDTGIVTLVDLERNAIIEEREIRHLPTMLTVEELDQARGLALADPNVRAALGPYAQRVVVEPLLVRTADDSDPWFGRRVVRLLFRVGQDYLSQPVVHVDLTSGQVHTDRGRH